MSEKCVHDGQQATRSCESKNKNRSEFNPCGKKCSSSAAFFYIYFFLNIPYSNSNSKEKQTNKQQNSFFVLLINAIARSN